jgi:hypothetical protein
VLTKHYALAFLHPESGWNAMAAVFGGVVLCVGLFALLTKLSRRERSGAWLRLDHFLPFVRKRRFPAGPSAVVVRLARRLLPATFFFDPATGAEGTLRRWCRKIGPTVLSAPLRRIVQGACFVTFLVLFFVVCWPYNSRPVDDGKISTGWTFAKIDQESGQLRFANDSGSSGVFVTGDRIFLAGEPAQEIALLSAQIINIDAGEAALIPDESPSSDAVQRLLLGTGSWAFHETEPGRWPSHYADNLANKEVMPADFFLIIDPLVSISTAIASRSWVWSLVCAGVILVVCVLIPRGFCGYICPLGTLIDLFDWAVGKRVKRFRVKGEGWWAAIPKDRNIIGRSGIKLGVLSDSKPSI